MPAVPPSQPRAPFETPGRGLAGARAGPTRRTARAARRSTASTFARGRTWTQSWTWRPSPRATAFGSRRHAAACWARSNRLAACATGRKSGSSPSL
eukprot:10760298-Alexandrium_andersonii.AAC.1